MVDDNLLVRTATAAEVEEMIEMAAREGWNPGLHDAACFRAADPEGFLVGVRDGRVIGGISAVAYGERFGFVGLYVVVPEERGGPCAIRLASRAMARLAGRVVGIDGVFERQAQYAHLGFTFAYRNIRYLLERRDFARSGDRIEPADAVPFDALLAYDGQCFPAPRERFLRGWLDAADSVSRVLLRGDRPAGFATIRRCRSGWKVGPLFADDRAAAEALLGALCSPLDPADPVYLDVPEANADAMGMVQAYGMREVFGTARMYRGGFPEIALEKVFGVTSFELG